ncbi:hypothetical protein ABIE26_004092 [Pedobacter africanus]|uniref:Uncharacterized protein n=1 Tax=Pedobacter africanus TaxID=151894 RepID=A0ACC6L1K4_9SPHI|nr:hypothetical protein [Pedobacter africanus]
MNLSKPQMTLFFTTAYILIGLLILILIWQLV